MLQIASLQQWPQADENPSMVSVRADLTSDDLSLATPFPTSGEGTPEEDGRGAIPEGTGFVVHERIGVGGTGLVHRATQQSLSREVAVKMIRPIFDSRVTRALLTREAKVVGALQHPNVVPIHDLINAGVEAGDSAPLAVMKRISGRTWAELFTEPRAVAELAPAMDAVEFHLSVLMTVCNAVHFAHVRGFVHRDLKPENVMVGEFGEVYVVDWGLAARLDPNGDRDVPLASDCRGLAGTPAYMAPEMLGGAEIGVWTDVFLLGSVLFGVVNGQPPYVGTLDDALKERIRNVDVKWRSGVPRSLRSLIAKAMAPAPGDRFATPVAFRDAIQAWLSRRADRLVLRASQRKMNRLLRELADPTGSSLKRLELHRLLGQARFGFRQLLDKGESPEASEGLRRVITAMVEYELARDDAEAAVVLLDELDDTPLELVEAVNGVRMAREAEDRRIQRLEDMKQRHDRDTGVRFRGVMILVAGGLCAALPWVAVVPAMDAWLQTSFVPLFGITLALMAGATLLAVVARNEMRRSRVTYNMVVGGLFAMYAQFLMDVGCWSLGATPLQTHVQHLFLWFCTTALVMLTVDRRVGPAALGFLAGYAFSVAIPTWVFLGTSFGCVVLVLNALWVLVARRPPIRS